LHNPPPAQLSWVVESLIDLKRQQYLRTTGRDFFHAPGIYDFYRKMMEPRRLGRISDISALTCGDKIVSAHLGFLGQRRFYYVLPAFDTNYRSLAVGHLLLDHMVQRCDRAGFAVFDLGEGDYAYKHKWATHRLPLLVFEQAMTASGRLYRQLRRVRRAVGLSGLSRLARNGGRRSPAVRHDTDAYVALRRPWLSTQP
jgi:CelD/BcsL family acetyltransferase involved in cellulose biosynthesis